jgi:membrane fusion protein (multidrug efflux system)
MQEKEIKLGEKADNVKMTLADGSPYQLRGKLSFADRQIDPSTGALTLEAEFKNSDNILRPGQYVKLRLVTDYRENALLIPQRAVNEMQGMFQVFAVGDSNKLKLKLIKIGPQYNMSYIVEEGLIQGDRIVVGGTQMLRNGTIINPANKTWSPDSTIISFVN